MEYEKKLMINNFTNINKTSTYLSLQIIEHKNTTTNGVVILAWDRQKNVAELNRLMGCQTSPF